MAAPRRPSVRPKGDPAAALSERAPWRPGEYDPADIQALQTLYRGQADEVTQKRALDFVIRISRNNGALYFPGEIGRRDTDFALGRNFVADQIVTLLKVNISKLRQVPSEQP